MMRYFLALTCLLFGVSSVSKIHAEEPNSEESAAKEKVSLKAKATVALNMLPKISSRASILKIVPQTPEVKNSDQESACVRQFVREMMTAKEKKANTELTELIKKIKTEEEARVATDKERRRRQDNYDVSWGALEKGKSTSTQAATRVKLDFQVLEIGSYRRAVKVCIQFETLARDIVEMLSKLDRDDDGRLTLDEYRDASSIVLGGSRLFQSLDSQSDGVISEADLEAAKTLPTTAVAVAKNGYASASAERFKLKNYDTNEDGVLDINERKKMVMAFVEASLRWKEEAAFYSRIVESLSVAREGVATKFADIEISR